MTTEALVPEPGSDDGQNLSSVVRPLSTTGWPKGYAYGATRYADVILQESFPTRFADLVNALSQFRPTLTELRKGGGGRTVFVKRFDDSLAAMKEGENQIWQKRRIDIRKYIDVDGQVLKAYRTQDHEIDMFGIGSVAEPIPAVAVEMEWNNKDPFYDRDLVSFQALWQEGAIALGVIVTRGPELQSVIGPTVRSKDGGLKFGTSTTHWNKLIPRVDLGGGGGCPLLLIGIDSGRIQDVDLARQTKAKLLEAAHFKATWRETYPKWVQAAPTHKAMVSEARAMMPPLTEVKSVDENEEDESLEI